MTRRRWAASAIWVGAALALTLGFAAYQRPEVAVGPAKCLWAWFQ